MNKKWCLVLFLSFSNNIFCAETDLKGMASLCRHNESIEAAEESVLDSKKVSLKLNELTEKKSLSWFGQVKRTIKSDLCIGDDIIEHKTFGSQLLASLRLVGYNMLTRVPVVLYVQGGIIPDLSEVRSLLVDNTNMEKAVFLGAVLFVGAGIVPVYEEALFTYLPQYLGKKKIKDSKMRSYCNLLPAALFGMAHYPNMNSYMHVAHVGFMNVLHQRYLLKRNANTVPYLNHSLNNLLAFVPPLLSLLM